jgi:hypothetical protein
MIDSIRKSVSPAILSREFERVDNLIQYLVLGKEKVQINEDEKNKLERYFFVYDQLNQKRSRHEVCNRIQAQFGVSRAQAYRDIFNAQYVITSSISIDEKFYEMFLLDSIIETIRLAAKKGDLRAKAQAERNLSIVLGYPKHDDNKIKPEMLQQNILIVSNDPNTLNLPRIADLQERIAKWSKSKPEKKVINIKMSEDE